MAVHYRNDSPRGITPPNLDAQRDVVAHITKHRGMKTPYTSVSEDERAIRCFIGDLYETESEDITHDNHEFITHSALTEQLKRIVMSSKRENRAVAHRAFMLASRAREALIDWQFDLDGVGRKDRITWCFNRIQRYFRKV